MSGIQFLCSFAEKSGKSIYLTQHFKWGKIKSKSTDGKGHLTGGAKIFTGEAIEAAGGECPHHFLLKYSLAFPSL